MMEINVGYAEIAEWLNAADCKSVLRKGYGGSNPSLSTKSSYEFMAAFFVCLIV